MNDSNVILKIATSILINLVRWICKSYKVEFNKQLLKRAKSNFYARNIVVWSMSHRMTDDLVLDALTMAYGRLRPTSVVKLHSDQGSQYNSRGFGRILKQLNIEPSISLRGNCCDNAVAESFFSKLKKEKLDVIL